MRVNVDYVCASPYRKKFDLMCFDHGHGVGLQEFVFDAQPLFISRRIENDDADCDDNGVVDDDGYCTESLRLTIIIILIT